MPEHSVLLSSGYRLPFVGLGTWQSAPGEVGKAVELAFKNGYRHIDCAYLYQNQEEIGQVLEKVFSSGTKQREDIFVTSKVWNTFHSYDKAKQNIEITLSQLKLDYLDLCLIHSPMGYDENTASLFPLKEDGVSYKYSNIDYLETWRALEDSVKEGKVRSIGLSNFNHRQIQRVFDNGRIRPAVLQVEMNPYFQQKKLRQYCSQKGIAFMAYSSLGNPGSAVFRKKGDANILEEPCVVEMANKHGKSPGQIALRWAVQNNCLVIPKSTNEERIRQNADLFSFTLTSQEMNQIDRLDRNLRFLSMDYDSTHPYYPFKEEF